MDDKVLVRLRHGYYNGGITPLPDVCPTIDAHIDCWHILIGEKMKNKDIKCECGSSPKHNNRIVELNGVHPYELSDAMKKYIVSKDDKYRVSNGNLIVNRDIACSKTTREGCTRADASNYISPDLMPNENIANKNTLNYRIRKLTPKECGRLMGVRDDDIDKMSVNQSNSSLYHCFGDSIVVDVLMAIFKQML